MAKSEEILGAAAIGTLVSVVSQGQSMSQTRATVTVFSPLSAGCTVVVETSNVSEIMPGNTDMRRYSKLAPYVAVAKSFAAGIWHSRHGRMQTSVFCQG